MKKGTKWLLWALDRVEGVSLLGGASALLLIMFLTAAEVLIRKLTPYSLPSLFEITSDYLMVALVFLSISHVYKMGAHVRVTLFEHLVPLFLRRLINWVFQGLGLAFFGLMTVAGFNSAVSAFRHSEVSSTILAYPMAPALSLVPIGAGLMCLRIIQGMVLPSTLGKRGEKA
jgi:TRAP-type C4-dicarboxylate transport system permease small subunit